MLTVVQVYAGPSESVTPVDAGWCRGAYGQSRLGDAYNGFDVGIKVWEHYSDHTEGE